MADEDYNDYDMGFSLSLSLIHNLRLVENLVIYLFFLILIIMGCVFITDWKRLMSYLHVFYHIHPICEILGFSCL